MSGYDMTYSQPRRGDSYGIEARNQYEGIYNGDPRSAQEFYLSKNEHYNSSAPAVPSNMRMVDSNVSRQMYEPSPRNKRTNTKVIHETLDDGTVISRQIVVEEEETLVERRLYKYEPTSPLMNRKHDPASAMAVQTGVHQAADFGYEGDEHTASNSKSSSRTSHWMPRSSKMNDEIQRPAQHRPPSSQHQTYEGVNIGNTANSVNGAIEPRYVLKSGKPDLLPLASPSMSGSGFVSSAASLSQIFPSFVSLANDFSSRENKKGHLKNVPSLPASSPLVVYSPSPTHVPCNSATPSLRATNSCNQNLVKATTSHSFVAPSPETDVSSRDSFSVTSPLVSVSSLSPLHSSVSVSTKTIEPLSNSYLQSSKSLKNKSQMRIRSSSQSSVSRKALELSKTGPINLDEATGALKTSLRSRSHPVLAAHNLDSLIAYPTQTLPNDEIQPVNELSSTGFSPMARDAYHPYRSLFGSSKGKNLNEFSVSAGNTPLKEVIQSQNGAITPQMRTKSVELRRSDVSSPVESRYGMVVDSSPDSSVDNIPAYLKNHDRAAVFSDSDVFDPQCDSGIDLPGKNLTFPNSVGLSQPLQLFESFVDTIKKRPGTLKTLEKDLEKGRRSEKGRSEVESLNQSFDSHDWQTLEDEEIDEADHTNMLEQSNNNLLFSASFNHEHRPNKHQSSSLFTSNPLSSVSSSSLVWDRSVNALSSSSVFLPSNKQMTECDQNYGDCFSSPTRKFPNMESPGPNSESGKRANRGLSPDQGYNYSVSMQTQNLYGQKRFPVTDSSDKTNPTGYQQVDDHTYKSIQSPKLAANVSHPSEKEFESLDPNIKFKLIKNLTDGDYAYRTFDSSQGTHSSRSTDVDKYQRNAGAPGQPQSERSTSRSRLAYNESFRNASKEDYYFNEVEMPELPPRISSGYHKSEPSNESTGLQPLRKRDDIQNAPLPAPRSAGPINPVKERYVYASSTGDLLKPPKHANGKLDNDLDASVNTYDEPTGSNEDFRNNFPPKVQHQRNRSDIAQKDSLTTHGFPIVNTQSNSGGSMVTNGARNLSVDNILAPNNGPMGNYDNAEKFSRPKQQRSSESMFIRTETVVTTPREPVLQPRMQSLNLNDANVQKGMTSERLTQSRRGVGEKPLDPNIKAQSPYGNKLAEMVLGKSCGRCLDHLKPGQDLVTSAGEIYHQECFVCAHCFLQFPNGVYFDFENRKYCEDDFNLMFAPSCASCGEFVKGRVIKAMGGRSWHPDCFKCSQCSTPLADVGFHSVKSRKDEAFCKNCADELNALESGKRFCGKCQALIENDGLRFKGEWYHAYHFNCEKCNAELTPTARESDGKLYCLKCSDSKTCALCRRTIEKYERSLIAMNKNWHPDCFRCSFCNKAFNGDKHFVYNAQPYCEEHYNQLFGNLCFYCNKIVPAPGVTVEQKMKKYCEHHFECFFCSKQLQQGAGDVLMLDGRPVCMKCTQRFPSDFKSKCFKNRSLDVGGSGNAKAKLLNPFKKK